MGFEPKNIADSIQQKIKQFLSNANDNEPALDGSLTSLESENLNQGLSGEYISSGFTEAEAKALANNFSGKDISISDGVEYTKKDDGGNTQNVLYGEQREGFLNLTPESLKYFQSMYPNAVKAFITNGIITILDINNNVIFDKNNNPVTINYNNTFPESKFNLVSFYLNHLTGDFDINKVSLLQDLQTKFNATSPTDNNYKELRSEIEVQKLDIMSDDERKHYMTSKMWNAFNKRDKAAWFDTLSAFYDYECRVIDKKLGITGAKNFIKEKTHLKDLIAYIDKVLDNDSNKLTKTELMWEIIKGVGDAIDSFIRAQGLTILGTATKTASTIPKIGPVVAGAIQAYFGTEGTALISSGVIDTSVAETEEQALTAGKDIGLGGIMAKGGPEVFKAGFKNLEVKQFRAKISESYTEEEINVIQKIIEESSYSKAEKQMLRNECAKQQGKIQRINNNVNNGIKPTPQNSPSTDKDVDAKGVNLQDKLEQQKVRSQVGYAIFKECKTPAQREMAKILLSDSRIYTAEKNHKFIYADILKSCETSEDVACKQKFIDKILANPKLLNKSGAITNKFIYCINAIKPEILDLWLNLLDEYQITDSKLNNNIFADMLLYFQDKESAEVFKAFFSNKKIDFNKVNSLDSDALLQICQILKESKEGLFDGLPIENVINNDNLRTVASANVYGNCSEQIKDIREKILSDKELQEKDEPIIIKNGQKNYNYALLIRRLLEHLSAMSDSESQSPLMNICSNILNDKNLNRDAKALTSINYITGGSSQIFCDILYKALKNGVESLSQKELSVFFKDIYMENGLADYVQKFVNNGYKPLKGDIIQEDITYQILMNDRQLIEDFSSNRTYTKEDLDNLVIRAHLGYGKDILADLCKQQEYSAEDIFKVMNHTLEHSVDLTKKILGVTTLTSREKVDLIVSLDVRDPQLKNLISVLIQQEALDLRTIPKILEAAKILDEHDAGGNNGKIDPKKMDKYVHLIQNPKTSPWVIQMLNEGWDMETISKLSPTKQAFYMEKLNGEVVEVKDKNVKFFMDFGLDVKAAEAIVKAISQNGTLNSDMQKTAVDLINAGIPTNKIGQILSSATILGEYNPRIPADAISVKNLGLNAFVERYLPIINNLSAEDTAVKFSSKLKKQLITMIENIPASIKPALRAKGFDLEGNIEKLKTELKRTDKKGKKEEFDKTKSKLQTLSNNKDYRLILEMMGIKVKVLPDETWEISHYKSYLNDFALNDYGINENELLANVSKIKGDADFKDSNASSLPNLTEVGGELNFNEAEISNLKELEKIRGKKINW